MIDFSKEKKKPLGQQILLLPFLIGWGKFKYPYVHLGFIFQIFNHIRILLFPC